MTPTGMNILQADEGTKLSPYLDSFGNVTVGIGHKLGKVIGGGSFLPSGYLSMTSVKQIFADDVARVEGALRQYPWFNALDDCRKDALVNMGFNLGIDGLLEFQHMIHFLMAQDWYNAAEAMKSSRWYQQLPIRVEQLANMIETGAYPRGLG